MEHSQFVQAVLEPKDMAWISHVHYSLSLSQLPGKAREATRRRLKAPEQRTLLWREGDGPLYDLRRL